MHHHSGVAMPDLLSHFFQHPHLAAAGVLAATTLFRAATGAVTATAGTIATTTATGTVATATASGLRAGAITLGLRVDVSGATVLTAGHQTAIHALVGHLVDGLLSVTLGLEGKDADTAGGSVALAHDVDVLNAATSLEQVFDVTLLVVVRKVVNENTAGLGHFQSCLLSIR